MIMKTCTKCGYLKSLKEFPINNQCKDGYDYRCRQCKQQLSRAYYRIHRDKMLDAAKQYGQEHKEELKQYKKEWARANKVKVKSSRQKYYKANREKVLKAAVRYSSTRKRRDPIFKLICNLRARMCHLIYKIKDENQVKTIVNLVGCSQEKLKQHIENQFKPGMSWNNYGKWQLDHIVPLSSASSVEEIYKLNYYTNLQPLWEVENKQKGNKRGIDNLVSFETL